METLNFIGLSGGKDSTALWGWAFNESGYDPKSIRGSFADTENEYQEVYDQIDRLDEYGQKRGAYPITRLKTIGFLNLAIKKKRFPSAKARFCTEHLKIIPTRDWIRSFLWLFDYEGLSHSGVRASESTERSLLSEYGDNGIIGCRERRPLLKWSLDEVWGAHRKWDLPVNRLYESGRKRVGCRLCCMSRKADIRLTAKTSPWVIDLYRQWEIIVGQHSARRSATFFGPGTVPPSQHSITVTDKNGLPKGICTIDDVVRWSTTVHGGNQQAMPFEFEEDDSHAPCQMGYCE